MQHRRRTAIVTAVSAVAVAAGSLSAATSAGAAAPKPVPTVHVKIDGRGVHLPGGSAMRAGKMIFQVKSGKGSHTLQVAKLNNGYTLAQAGADLNKAFGGDVAAIRRVDDNVSFRGGAEATPSHPGAFGISLARGKYLLLDQDSNAYRWITVWGKAPARRALPSQGGITAYSYGFGTSSRLNHSGWLTFNNVSDQPHFLVMQRVKSYVTPKMVRKYFASGSQQNPKWALKANTDTGVVSPYRAEVLKYDLPAGKYLIACFWPDDDTGMPHALMGMWKLITLK